MKERESFVYSSGAFLIVSAHEREEKEKLGDKSRLSSTPLRDKDPRVCQIQG